MKFPNRRFNLIYADPPWPYRDKNKAGNRELKYPTMTINELKELPINKIAKDDCYLFLWVTSPLIREGFDVMKAWGFNYNTIAFTWIKTNKISDSLFWGMGNSTRANAEYVLLGKKGKLDRLDAGVHSIVMEKIQKHSKKPDEVRDRIIRLYGKLPRIELFARDRVYGWKAWGNDAKLLS